MSTPENAHAATVAAEQRQHEAEANAQTQQAVAQAAQQAAAQARAQADANPTPENMNAVAKANKKAAEATRQATAATQEQTAAVAAANSARLAEVQAIVSANNEKIVTTRSNPNGFQFSTDHNLEQFTPGNFARLIMNNMHVRVTGVERKVILGASGTLILGAKNEFVLACKNNLIVGFDIKTVTGANKNTFLGLKMDTIGGAKIDRTSGDKRETHAGPKVYFGPADTTVAPENETKAGVRKAHWSAMKDLFKKDTNVSGRRSLRASKVLEDIKALEEKVATLKTKVDKSDQLFKTLTMKSATIKISSSGNLAYRAKGTATADGGGAKVVLSGSAELSKGGSIKCDGAGISINGTVKIN